MTTGIALQGKQRLHGVARIEIAATLLRVAERQEDLGDGQSPLAPELLVGVGETDLPDRGRGLALLQRERTFGQPEFVAPERDGAGGNEHDLLAGLGEAGDVVHQ